MNDQHDTTQRREYRRPAAPDLVTSIPEAANNDTTPSGQDFSFYVSLPG